MLTQLIKRVHVHFSELMRLRLTAFSHSHILAAAWLLPVAIHYTVVLCFRPYIACFAVEVH